MSLTASKVTFQEQQWAMAIKEAAQQDAEINAQAMSDLEFVQHALVAKANVAKALTRIKRLQAFKQSFGIKLDGSFEEACRDLSTFWQTHPGFALSLGVLNDSSGRAIGCCDMAGFRACHVKSEESMAVAMRGLFYLFQAMQMNITTMRAGIVFLCDSAQAGWQNVSFPVERHWATLYSNAYPVRLKKLVMMRANLFVRWFHLMCRMFISKKVMQVYEFTALDKEMYVQNSNYPSEVLPKSWGGSLTVQETQDKVLEHLKQRYQLAQTFRL